MNWTGNARISIQPLLGKNVFLKERKQNKTKRHEISEYPGNLTLYVSYFSLGGSSVT